MKSKINSLLLLLKAVKFLKFPRGFCLEIINSFSSNGKEAYTFMKLSYVPDAQQIDFNQRQRNREAFCDVENETKWR